MNNKNYNNDILTDSYIATLLEDGNTHLLNMLSEAEPERIIAKLTDDYNAWLDANL